MKLKTIILLCTSLFSYCVAYSQCNYLAYEPFDGTANTPLHGHSDGSGWSEPWIIQNDDNNVPGYQFEAGNLSSGSLQTYGNRGGAGLSYQTGGRRLDTSPTGPFSAYLTGSNSIGLDGTTLWFSVLLQKNNDDANRVFTELNGDNVGWVIFSQPHVGVGYYGADSDVSGVRMWSLRVGSTVYPTSEPVVAGTPILAVFSITFDAGAGHQIDLYINPALGPVPPASPTISQLYVGDLWIRSVAVYGEDSGDASLDEIRFATSYECVAPDAGVLVNLPPTAVITATPTSGTAPLNVNLDAAASSDPDGTIVAYEWNLGDGTAPFTQTSPTPFAHVFEALGVLEVSLKVTDNNGSTHLITQEIIVTDAAGTFPCQAGADLTPATCGNNDGSIEVLNVWNGLVQSHSLANTGGTSFPATINSYDNLPPDDYVLSVTGTHGCSNSFDLKVLVDSSTCAGWTPDVCRMDFGMNLNYPAYYTTERPFKNLFRFNGGFYTTDAAMHWIPTNQYDAMPKDADGYPLEVPWTSGGMDHIVKVVISSNHYYPQETLVVLYDGDGDIQCTETMQNITPGRFEIVVGTDGQILFDIYASTLGNHIRNIRVLRLADEFDDLVAEPFHDTFLERLAPFRAIRFMNWMSTNHSQVSSWSDRTLPNHYDQSLASNISGVSYEYIAQLCNTLQRDAWICIPHLADDNYIIQLGQFFNTNLDPNLIVYIEYSNEVWNWGFTQAHWVTDNGPTNISYPRRHAERATRAMNLFRSQFGANASRVKRVLGTQLTNNWVSNEILSQADPNDYDYLSPTAYFGWGGSCAAALDATSTPLDVINCTRTTFLSQYASWRQDYFNTRMYGKEVVNYESGNHMTTFDSSIPFATANRDAQTHPEIYNLYQEVIDSLRRLDCRLSMFFVLASRLGNSQDVFGHLDYVDQAGPFLTTAPKYQVLLDNIDDCAYVQVGAKACLQGAYDAGSGTMRHDLNTSGLIPPTEPYTTLGYTHVGGGGGETMAASAMANTGDDIIVDWVFLELRDPNTPTTVLATRAALLQKDGDIVDVDGASPVRFNSPPGRYHLVVRHRNHLGVMTESPIQIYAF